MGCVFFHILVIIFLVTILAGERASLAWELCCGTNAASLAETKKLTRPRNEAAT